MNQVAFHFPAAAHKRVGLPRATECTEAQDAREPSWSERAYAALLEFARQREGEWLGEEAIYWMTNHGLPAPPDKRAFGTVFVNAVKRGAIVRTGWSKNTRNCSMKPTYRRGNA